MVAGFFSFTEITDETAHRGYNAWHQLDHLPQQLPLPGIAHGQRWVSTPACRSVTRYAVTDHEGAPDLSSARVPHDLPDAPAVGHFCEVLLRPRT